jgi:hypothetical protein
LRSFGAGVTTFCGRAVMRRFPLAISGKATFVISR